MYRIEGIRILERLSWGMSQKRLANTALELGFETLHTLMQGCLQEGGG